MSTAKKSPIPKSIKVGPHWYTIVREDGDLADDENGNLDTDGLKIAVRSGLRRSKAQEVALHEVIHACVESKLDSEKESYTEEDFVKAIAPTLLQVLQDNPAFVAFLTEGVEPPKPPRKLKIPKKFQGLIARNPEAAQGVTRLVG